MDRDDDVDYVDDVGDDVDDDVSDSYHFPRRVQCVTH